MARIITAKIKLVYEDATSRTYTFNGIDAQSAMGMKSKIKALNQAIERKTTTDAAYFVQTFVSDTGSPCKMISDARYIITEQEVIYSAN